MYGSGLCAPDTLVASKGRHMSAQAQAWHLRRILPIGKMHEFAASAKRDFRRGYQDCWNGKALPARLMREEGLRGQKRNKDL